MYTPQQRFCTHCGAPLEGNSRFCEQCGQPVDEDVSTSPQAPYTPPPPVPSQSPSYPPARPVPPQPVPPYTAPPSQPPIPPPAYQAARPAPVEQPPAQTKKSSPVLIVAIILIAICALLVCVGGFLMRDQLSALTGMPVTGQNTAQPATAQPSATQQQATKPAAPGNPPTQAPPAPPTAVPPTAKPAVSIPPCPGAQPAKLKKGDHAKVVNVGGYSIIFYDQPQSSATEVGAVPEGTTVIIRDGPTCAEKSYWWKVEFGEGGRSGWAMEATSDGTYLLQAIP